MLTLIERRQQSGSDSGWVDVHLLAATMLTTDSLLRTRDRRLAAVAAEVDVAAKLETG